MTTNINDSLLTQLLLKHPDATPEEYKEFYRKVIEHRFTRMLHIYDTDQEIPQVSDVIRTLSAEKEITFLLDSSHPEIFLNNIIYHLQRNKKVLPPVLLPGVLTIIKKHPELWVDIYHQHPKLIDALAYDNNRWKYMNRTFDSDFVFEFVNPDYFDSLKCRMQLMPLHTTNNIRRIYADMSVNQQARLVEILHEDQALESRDFIVAQINHSRKPVRLAALKSCIKWKEKSVYEPIRNSLANHLKVENGKRETKPLTVSWKDLGSLCDESSKQNILMALTDPDEYQVNLNPSFLREHHSTVQKAATLHRSQKTICNLLSDTTSTLYDPNLIKATDSKTAVKILNILLLNNKTTFDQKTIDLLKRVHPFLNEADSEMVWEKFANQWRQMPFTLEELPLDILALRIHPNRINTVWKHQLLQETAPALQKIREILKNRLVFLKKCYKN